MRSRSSIGLFTMLFGTGCAAYPVATAPVATAPVAEPFADLVVLDRRAFPGAAIAAYGTNPTVETQAEPVSGLSPNCGRGSFDRALANLAKGRVPDPDAIRVEEMQNVAAPAPPAGAEIALSAEVVPSPHRHGYHVLVVMLGARSTAHDVSMEVAFNPAAVRLYRRIGYESRSPGRPEGGTFEPGNSAAVLFELKLQPGSTSDLGAVRLRCRVGATPSSTEWTIRASDVRPQFQAGQMSTQLAVLASAFGEKLHGSYWVRHISYAELLSIGTTIAPESELTSAIAMAAKVDKRPDRFEAALPVAEMNFDRLPEEK